MRLRTTTAVVFAGALALVLPTAGQSLADDNGGRTLGTLHYRFVDDGGDERSAQLRPAENDTCYVLTRTSDAEPAVEVVNETESLAVLFDNRTCDGKAERVLEPGQRAQDVEAVSVFFKPVDRPDAGRDDQAHEDQAHEDQARDDQGRDDQARDDQGRQDQAREDQARQDEGRGDWNGRDDQAAREDMAREDMAREDMARGDAEGEDFLDRVLRTIG
ncbi:hypothetical protein ACFCZ1_14035 [Streptomyces sp. NPDC056224]|uniref:hypothetical protein n=1 Tax=Streptomyces sp. NPDC056224 TaxID=3345750 RepID=UPI0035DBD967